MTVHVRRSIVCGALVLAACGGQPDDMDPQLKADLEAASAGTLELAPSGGSTAVVSGIEQVGRTEVRNTAPRPRTQVTARTKTPTPQSSPEPAATAPVSRPAVQPPPPGGYKTVDEVIRKAPFPIKPATKKPGS